MAVLSQIVRDVGRGDEAQPLAAEIEHLVTSAELGQVLVAGEAVGVEVAELVDPLERRPRV